MKNLFVLIAPFYDGTLGQWPVLQEALTTGGIFCLASSAVYAFNDAMDAEADRSHPAKRLRPVAAGAVTRPAAMALALALAAVALGLCLLMDPMVLLAVAVYLVLNLGYSLGLKRIAGLDVGLVSLGFVLRVWAGAEGTGVRNFSIWLHACTFLFALFISVGKRHSELGQLGTHAAAHRASLGALTLRTTASLVWGSGLGLGLVYAWYALFADTILVPYPMMGLTIPAAWFLIGYYMRRVLVHLDGDSPETMLFQRRPLQWGLVTYFGLVTLLLYVFPWQGP